jgi:cytochrome c oxidase subunit 2
MNQIDRRTFLASSAAVAAGLVAGCTEGPGGAASGGDGGNDGSDDPATTTDSSTTEESTTEQPTTEAETTSDGGDSGDSSDSSGSSGEVDREVTVEMESFKLIPGSTHKGEDPLVVQQGDTIRLRATATDNGLGSGHGLAIDAFGVNLVPVRTEQSQTTTFTADEAGEYEMYCSIQCSQPGAGSGHESMTGTLVVE